MKARRPRIGTGEPTSALIEATGKCAGCHRHETPAIVDQFERSRHAVKGVTCLDCHHPVGGRMCYIDAHREPDTQASPWTGSGQTREQLVEGLRNTPTHLCRLRHFGPDRWSVAFYMRYEPSFFGSGEDVGTPEEGLDVGAIDLT